MTENAQRGEDVSAPMAYSRCGFVLEGHIRRSKLNPDGTSTTWSIVVPNQVLADRAGSSFCGHQDGSDGGDSGFWPNCVSYRWA